MPVYTPENTLRLAKRYHNPKRSYLLVNPLQGKHMPVSPSAALAMMDALGDKIAAQYPHARLVIGFAETATAIGARVARALGPNCIYIHTTRENAMIGKLKLKFQEEHSHAVDQMLSADHLNQWIAHTPQVIFVDDELSTGKTLVNMIAQIQDQFPIMKKRTAVAASIINRLSPENEEMLAANGVESLCLVKLPQEDYAEAVAAFEVNAAVPAMENGRQALFMPVKTPLFNSRMGCDVMDQLQCLHQLHRKWVFELEPILMNIRSLLILGTEEYMLPALSLGAAIEWTYPHLSVFCHATTRSPIGILDKENYPIRSGYKLCSLYEEGRDTYIYNLRPYDLVIVLTDAETPTEKGASQLLSVLEDAGCHQVILLTGGRP